MIEKPVLEDPEQQKELEKDYAQFLTELYEVSLACNDEFEYLLKKHRIRTWPSIAIAFAWIIVAPPPLIVLIIYLAIASGYFLHSLKKTRIAFEDFADGMYSELSNRWEKKFSRFKLVPQEEAS